MSLQVYSHRNIKPLSLKSLFHPPDSPSSLFLSAFTPRCPLRWSFLCSSMFVDPSCSVALPGETRASPDVSRRTAKMTFCCRYFSKCLNYWRRAVNDGINERIRIAFLFKEVGLMSGEGKRDTALVKCQSGGGRGQMKWHLSSTLAV